MTEPVSKTFRSGKKPLKHPQESIKEIIFFLSYKEMPLDSVFLPCLSLSKRS